MDIEFDCRHSRTDRGLECRPGVFGGESARAAVAVHFEFARFYSGDRGGDFARRCKFTARGSEKKKNEFSRAQ